MTLILNITRIEINIHICKIINTRQIDENFALPFPLSFYKFIMYKNFKSTVDCHFYTRERENYLERERANIF